MDDGFVSRFYLVLLGLSGCTYGFSVCTGGGEVDSFCCSTILLSIKII